MSDRIYGIHAVRELIDADPARIRSLKVAAGRRASELAAIVTQARNASIRVDTVDRSALNRLAEGGSHQGILAECHAVRPTSEAAFEERFATLSQPLLLALDHIEDPRNLGACLRSAEAAGVDAVLVPRRRSAPLSGVAAKAASGAMEHLTVVEVANLARRLDWLREQGVWVVGGDADGDVAYTDVPFDGAIAIVIGSEGKGLRRLTRERCDFLARIPLAGKVASLNVSVATSILLFEAVRQRG
ncbi:MAG: 23S rRNA (guanosine(2251)-2'-O)-methyltransferase RlmB [Gammaproteobacteria bacterium]|nr:23S rRNA (guanosine(2251)-2'-O)-methyltransferase RlmB [Gammaproteobacteria bacterium]